DPYGRHWLLEPGEDGEYFTSDDGDPYPLALPAYASPFLFTGREFDGETGLHCYRNRYFNFRSGSFTGRDPAGFRPGVNLYGYCNLNPECLLDPFGLACSWAVGRCIRNVSNITVPTSYHGIPIPAWARAATNAVIPDHQNVKIVSYKGENLTGEEDESVVRGFFADDFNGAVSEYALSLIPLAGFNGWVPGHVASDENPGACWLASVSRARYDLIKRRMLANHDTEYHLTTYNCQHWATRQLL
ncbi:MAG: RHS repeat-associated core domain-containing protein, partial [Candidatus Sumerlaeota bacterium]|nr:RHS repeat-associated core domain-containing protein [Candidatus Sumerlaeota bacterium]